MGTGAPSKTPSKLYPRILMTRSLALSLLRSGKNGAEVLRILDTVTASVEDENIEDVASHFATLQGADPAVLEF